MDNIERPTHYKFSQPVSETIEVLKELGSEDEFLGFCYLNILKYMIRCKKKNGLEDIKKARQYMDWLISGLESKGDN